MKDNKTRLIIVSYYDPGTGFYSIVENISTQLFEEFEIHYIGIGYQGDPVQTPLWRLYPGKSSQGDFAATYCSTLATYLGSGIILIINDLWVIGRYKQALSLLKPSWKIHTYIPIDGTIVRPQMVTDSTFVNTLVLFNQFGLNEIKHHIASDSIRSQSLPDTSLEIIPLGLDEAFYRFSFDQKQRARQEIFKDESDWWDSFIVLNANRFSERKRLDLTLRSFKLFSGDKKDVRLYLHQPHIKEQEYEVLINQITEMGLHHLVKVSRPGRHVPNKSELNKIYNCCDIGINTSTGEGWGLVSFEHAATGSAQIVPAHSACQELWEGMGLLIETAKEFTPRFEGYHIMKEIDIEKASNALNQLYLNEGYRKIVSDRCHWFATNEIFSWASVGRQWKKLFNQK